MQKLSPEQVLPQLEWRCSVKKFDSEKKINKKDWDAIEKALQLTPSSFGLQPWNFIIVEKDMALRSKLKAVSWNQDQVTDCSHYLIICQKEGMDSEYIQSFMDEIAKTRNVSLESLVGYQQVIQGFVSAQTKDSISQWNARQCYIALGNIMTAAAALGVDSCPMEGFDRAQYDEILGLNGSGFKSVVCCALGFRHPDDAYPKLKKVRFPVTQIFQYR